MRRAAVKLNKPIHHGVTVLDRAKLPMYAWNYDYMALKYEDKAELAYTDMDSFIYEIKTDDIYKDIRADVRYVSVPRGSSSEVTDNEQKCSRAYEGGGLWQEHNESYIFECKAVRI